MVERPMGCRSFKAVVARSMRSTAVIVACDSQTPMNRFFQEPKMNAPGSLSSTIGSVARAGTDVRGGGIDVRRNIEFSRRARLGSEPPTGIDGRGADTEAGGGRTGSRDNIESRGAATESLGATVDSRSRSGEGVDVGFGCKLLG
jgi:hypothetical protein